MRNMGPDIAGVSDEQVYKDMGGPVSEDEILRAQQLLDAWRIATEEVSGERITTRIVFLACMQVFNTMGPAYCRLAAFNLLRAVADAEKE
jgi:hypothetical protein